MSTAEAEATTTLNPLDYLDTDWLLSDEEKLIRDNVRSFVRKEVLPHVGDWFDKAELPARELAKQFGDLGLLGMHLTGYGCAGASPMSYGLAVMELEAGDSGIRSLVSVQGSLAMYAIWKYGSDEQKEEWLPAMAAGDMLGCFGLTEPDFGSNPGGMRTRAKRDGDDWVLNGQKMWITNGSIADVAVVWARTDDGVRGFVVPTETEGFSAPEIHKKMSLRASVTSELVLDDVRLPGDAILPGTTGVKSALGCLNEARTGIVFGAMGAARACLESAVEYSKTRVQFDRPIGGFQLTQKKLADMAVEVNRGTILAYHLARLKEAGRAHAEQVSMGKLANVNAALWVAREARQILGGNGITLEYPVIRHMNNLESVVTYEGTAEVHALVIGHALTGIPAFR
ncbi:MAG: glutaryl-CoA dehydrogenase [Solirubrobacteraceae bacterium]|jgi:glutaryl-CoA dehydrogenase|nr:glutaryl-CoA dehydrogenase [Solirubrobacteraceae bacterium]